MYKSQGAPEDRLELLRQYMEDTQNLLERAQQEQPPPQQLTKDLAEAGAATAAAEVAENIPDEQNPLLTGALDLSPDEDGEIALPEEAFAEETVEEEIIE